jgi:hypothetical protein
MAKKAKTAQQNSKIDRQIRALEQKLDGIAKGLKSGLAALKSQGAPTTKAVATREHVLNNGAHRVVLNGFNGKVLTIAPRLSKPDDLAIGALVYVAHRFEGSDAKARKFIQKNSLGTAMTRFTTSLNNSAVLDETDRLLLSHVDIYGAMVLGLLEDITGVERLEKFVNDREGFRIALLTRLADDDGARQLFFEKLATESLRRGGVQFDPESPEGRRLIADLREKPVALTAGRIDSALETRYEQIIADGPFPGLVDAYAASQEVDTRRFTSDVKQAMVRHLIARGVVIETPEQRQRFLQGGYDEYFALAYDQAAASAAGDDDPIATASVKGASLAPWDFQVDTFESIEEQGIIKENILAAGALDYVFELGERLGIFRLADSLTLNWAAGAIDVVEGPCAHKLYRYWKLRDQRMDPSERGLVYKRVLNKGETEALDRMVVNEKFENLWGVLAEKVTEYRTKVEDASAEQAESLMVSRAPVQQAVRELQYNLTEFCTGMAHMQVREMYSQLRDAMDLLGDPEIIDHFAGGRRKTMWTAIERLSKSEYGEAPNINAIRIAAVEGNAVFRFIANFKQGAVPEDEFQRFLEAAEAWIIAKATDDSMLLGVTEDEGDEEAADESEFEDATV